MHINWESRLHKTYKIHWLFRKIIQNICVFLSGDAPREQQTKICTCYCLYDHPKWNKSQESNVKETYDGLCKVKTRISSLSVHFNLLFFCTFFV